MLTRATDNMIEQLILSTYGQAPDPRSRHLLFHALQGLVRTAKAEQVQQLRRDGELAGAERALASSRQQTLDLMRSLGVTPAGQAGDAAL